MMRKGNMCMVWVIVVLSACQPEVSSTQQQSIPHIIFDTDMGSDCDDVGALALLHHYSDLGKAEVLATVYSSGKVPYGAGMIDAINRYYGRPGIPVGAYYGDDVGDPVDKMSAEKLAKDTAAYHNRIVHNRDAMELTALLREVLSKQPDQFVHYVTVGHTKGLYDLLVSGPDSISVLPGKELVENKVIRWVALGALNAASDTTVYHRDWNFFFNGTAPYTRYLVNHFPVPIYFVDAGEDVMTGRSLKETPPGNIVRTAYRDWLWWYEERTLDDQRPSWDLAAVYFAVHGEGDYLTNLGSGFLEFDPEKGDRWFPDKSGSVPQYYIVQKEGVAVRFADYLNQCIAAEPMY